MAGLEAPQALLKRKLTELISQADALQKELKTISPSLELQIKLSQVILKKIFSDTCSIPTTEQLDMVKNLQLENSKIEFLGKVLPLSTFTTKTASTITEYKISLLTYMQDLYKTLTKPADQEDFKKIMETANKNHFMPSKAEWTVAHPSTKPGGR